MKEKNMKFRVLDSGAVRIGVLALLMLPAAVFSPAASAQTAITQALSGSNCAAERFGDSLNCTANDFTTIVTIDSPDLGSCRVGEQITVDVRVPLQSGSAVRYDGSIFFGENGPANLRNQISGSSCSVAAFPLAPTPFYDHDNNVTNQCGDFQANSTADWRVENVVMTCRADANGNMTVPWLLSYDNLVQGGTCSVTTARPGTKAKCQTGSATVSGMTANGWVRIVKQTNPDGATQSFDFSASAGTGMPTPASFSLTDGAEQYVEVALTGGSNTLTITEDLMAGWEPDASIVCTAPGGGAAPYVTIDNANRSLTANLDSTNYGAECTITNTRVPQADLSIVKTVQPETALVGDTVAYVLAVGNAGPDSADGAIVHDPVVAGLDCSAATPTCSATGGAQCPASPTIAGLQGTGLVIPVLPVGDTVTIELSCVVTAP